MGFMTFCQTREHDRVVAEVAEVGITILKATEPPVGDRVVHSGARRNPISGSRMIAKLTGRGEHIMLLDMRERDSDGRVKEQPVVDDVTDAAAGR